MNDRTTETSRPSVKKPYKEPKLVKLGTLRDLTMNTTGGHANDGGVRGHGNTPLKTGRGGRNGRGRV